MREPYSIEAEHGLLGAMMQRPELIDSLSDDLSPESFYFPANAEVYRGILAVRDAGKSVDFLTVGNHVGSLADGSPAFAYCAEIVHGTPSVASAKTYAGIVRERAIERSLFELGTQAMDIAHSDQDVQAKIAAVQAAAMAIDCGAGDDDIVKVGDVLADQLEVWQERHDRHARGETLIGLSTGLKDLDEKLGGLQPDHLYIVAGRPAMGKTTLAMGFVIDAAVRQSKSVLVISLEMKKGQLLDRAVASEGRVPLTLVKNGTACQSHGAELSAAAGILQRAPLYIADRAGSSIGRIRSLARRHKMRYGLDLLMIDYLQLLEGEGGNRTEEVSSISRGCKLLANELGIPVVLLSQLSRKCEERPNKRPIPSDLRESGAIEQDADVILFVYRDEVYHENTDAKGIAEIIIGKGRDIEMGTVRTAFLGQYNRFENLAAGWKPEPVEQPEKVTSLASRYRQKDKF
ncbi:replicative DNA helicase [Pseudomonas vancouverensis]|uniref:Replicative DNA helicase n=1 Tax=Pseudomonas vancouverensis TaxID=95300 RepID=A0A1H2N7P7_PSEVA|nr:replicative DNA helicase [Pseudomonas vancouverensis]KAB0494000.1 replicative DNA helicase [Pseudomonas vancouverensis]TDB63520.1 replicative DNA helicase [Pseudomonas vancouverensis]SDV01537.1 replicative DNA helicase [Pseudomonas vancouverensis]